MSLDTTGPHITPNVWCIYELFSWDPRQLYSDMFNVFEVVVSRIYTGFEQYLKEADTRLKGKYRVEFEHGSARFKAYLNKRVDDAVERFEVFTKRNVLNVPRELITGGWLRTAAQVNVDFTRSKDAVRRLDQLLQAEDRLNQRRLQLRERKLKLQELTAKRNFLRAELEKLPDFTKETENRLLQLIKDGKDIVPNPKRARTQSNEDNDWIEDAFHTEKRP